LFEPLHLPSVILAFAITLVEMTEVVALVFALGAEGGALRPAALGATLGTVVVAGAAAVAGAGLASLPRSPLLWGAAVTLFLFGIFLFRSTLRTYRKIAHPPGSAAVRPASMPFAGGFAVGCVEAIEVVIVLVALAAGGHGFSALVGALSGGALLVVVAFAVHERVRRIKVPTLKLGATGALFAFALFWGTEASGARWPGPQSLADLWLIPLFGVAALAVWAVIRWRVPASEGPGAKG
jgi:uncharacterized membrane protein